LDQGSDEFVKRSAADALPLKQANPVLFDWFINQMERIAEDRRKLYGLVPTFLTDVSIVADDFNPQIGKYLCRMTYRYNEAVFVPFWDSTLRLNLLGDPTAQAGYQAELEKSRESASFELAVKLGMQKFRAYESAQERRTETLR
ncbi:hypothetical protein JZU71_01395, partial [bacterium]|nr:hypothetical protein [bacterium]